MSTEPCQYFHGTHERLGNNVHRRNVRDRNPNRLANAYALELLFRSIHIKPQEYTQEQAIGICQVGHTDTTTTDDGKVCIVANDGTRLIKQTATDASNSTTQ
jgi:hypothetical protein